MNEAPPSWLRVKTHAEHRIDALRTSLETARPDQVIDLQAEIRAWRQVLNLPSTLSNEPIASASAGYA